MSIHNRDSLRNAEPTDAEVLDAAYRIVSSTRKFFVVEPPGQDIIDETTLPFVRSTIVNAFRLAIATEPRADLRNDLVIEGSLLAQYQGDVGPRISVTPASVQLDTVKDEGRYRYHLDRLFEQVVVDRRRLRGLFGRASRIAERKFELASYPPPFQDDGTYTPFGHSSITPRHSSPTYAPVSPFVGAKAPSGNANAR